MSREVRKEAIASWMSSGREGSQQRGAEHQWATVGEQNLTAAAEEDEEEGDRRRALDDEDEDEDEAEGLRLPIPCSSAFSSGSSRGATLPREVSSPDITLAAQDRGLGKGCERRGRGSPGSEGGSWWRHSSWPLTDRQPSGGENLS